MTKFDQNGLANNKKRKQYFVSYKKVPLSLDPESLFVHFFRNSKVAFWLDSSLIVSGLSRWSFMGEPCAKDDKLVEFYAESHEIKIHHFADNKTETLTRSIFSYLEEINNQCFVKNKEDLPDLPFLGGHVGYFGYELKLLTCEVPSFKSELPDAAFLFSTRFLAIDHANNELYIIALCDMNENNDSHQWVEKIASQLECVSAPAPTNSSEKSSDEIAFQLRHNREDYISSIEECLEKISLGETYEVCLTNEVSAQIEVDPLDLYRVLRERNPAPYSAFLRFEEFSVVCSSPERFLKVDRESIVEAKPIKGTARRDKCDETDSAIAETLREDEKSRSENLMIVDLLRNDLGRVCTTGSVHVPSLMHIESYRTVHQLVSTIRGEIHPDESIISCIESCFPGGSMTGAPKKRTLEIIDRLEKSPRGVYSGSIGYVSLSEDVDLNIVIRTIICKGDSVSVGCGGAIVALSDPVEEFDEILLKAYAPLSAIAETLTGNLKPDFIINGAS